MHMTYAAQVQLKHNVRILSLSLSLSLSRCCCSSHHVLSCDFIQSVINIFRQHGLLAASTPTLGDVPPPEHGAELPQYLNSRGNVVRVLPPRGSPLQFGYRHKARTSVRYVEKKGGALVGFREMFSSKVANLESCPVVRQPSLPAASSEWLICSSDRGRIRIRIRVAASKAWQLVEASREPDQPYVPHRHTVTSTI